MLSSFKLKKANTLNHPFIPELNQNIDSFNLYAKIYYPIFANRSTAFVKLSIVLSTSP